MKVKKKDVPKNIYKPTTENVKFFIRVKRFIIKKRLKVSKNPEIYYYCISTKDDTQNINNKGL